MDENAEKSWSSLESLPVEVLVHTFSFLSTLDKVKLRYVSHRVRCAVQTPLLWKEFVWTNYESSHERCVKSVLRVCGKQVARFSLSGHVTPSKQASLIQYCTNVTHLTLPFFDPKQLTKVFPTMKYLQQLDIRSDENIKSLLATLNCVNLKELTLRVRRMDSELAPWESWDFAMWRKENIHLPQVVNLVTGVTEPSMHYHLLENASLLLPGSKIRIFDSTKVPLDLHPPMPLLRIENGQQTTPPYVRASSHGLLLGIEHDALELIDYEHLGKTKHVAMLDTYYVPQDDDLDCVMSNLDSVTYFDATFSGSLYPGHLEQIAAACPNLELLNLRGNGHCLQKLDGLRYVASKCSNLQGVNLAEIPATDVQSILLLWEALSDIKKLTHIAVRVCMLKPGSLDESYQRQLLIAIRKCHGLQAIEVDITCTCTTCGCITDEEVLLPYFPSLQYCRLYYDHIRHCSARFDHQNLFNHLIATCQKLKYVSYDGYSAHGITLPLSSNCRLQQLCIDSHHTVFTDVFMDLISAHGGLVHVVLYVQSTSIKAITTIIENSPQLRTFYVISGKKLFDERGRPLNFTTYKTALRKKYSHRVLFVYGTLMVAQWSLLFDKNEILSDHRTDLNSLWGNSIP